MSDEKIPVVVPPGHSSNPSATTTDEEKPQDDVRQQIQPLETDSVSEKDDKKKETKPVRITSFHDYLVCHIPILCYGWEDSITDPLNRVEDLQVCLEMGFRRLFLWHRGSRRCWCHNASDDCHFW